MKEGAERSKERGGSREEGVRERGHNCANQALLEARLGLRMLRDLGDRRMGFGRGLDLATHFDLLDLVCPELELRC